MPIREESFRIGCGRYLQKPGLLRECGKEIARYGHAPLIVGGSTALSLTRQTIECSVAAVCEKYKTVIHSGSCNDDDAAALAKYAEDNGFDVIVGVGGGVIMDFAKLIGCIAMLPVVNIPTSSATCACFTPLSVRYTKEGRTVGTRHFEQEIDSVLVDTAVLAAQPIRLMLSGVFDALAKFVEIKQRFNENTVNYPLGLDWGYVMSKRSFAELSEKTEKCIEDMKAGTVTNTVEQVMFTCLAVTGVISGIARGSNQTALAHKFYETTRLLFHTSSRPYLHGEIVGVGLLLQNHFNGEEQNNIPLLGLMKKYGMPRSVAEVGVDMSDESFNEYYACICESSAIDKNNTEECKRFKNSLRYLWELR